jgi:hypothetical protein
VSTLVVERIDLEQWAESVSAVATTLGWRVCLMRPVMTPRGLVWPYRGHAGLPNLVMARRAKTVMAVLAVGREVPTLDQRAWLAAAGQQENVWRPGSLDKIRAVLQ